MKREAHKRNTVPPQLARWAIAGLFSLLGHLVFLLFFALVGFFNLSDVQTKIEPPARPVALRSMSSAAWNANRTVDSAPRQKAEQSAVAQKPEEEKKKPEAMPKGRVVDVAPGNNQKPDDNAKYLATSNNRVEKETRSRDATPFYRNAMPKPSSPVKPSEGSGHDIVEKDVIAGNGGKGSDDTPAKNGEKKRALEIPKQDQRDRLALRFDGLGGKLKSQTDQEEVSGNSNRLFIQRGGETGSTTSDSSAGRAGNGELRTLMPSATVLDQIAGAPANDMTPLDDVEQGAGTFLNTREWKYSSFFNRVRQNVGMHWNPNSILRTRDPTGESYLYKDRYTVVSVTLGSDGALISAGVDKSCGVDFLDGEAVAAFKRAQPFPNPPPALRNERGEIKFSFGFYVEVGHGLRLFRSR